MFLVFLFFFNDPATTEIYTLSLHDALPIYRRGSSWRPADRRRSSSSFSRICSTSKRPRTKRLRTRSRSRRVAKADRKSTRLNSSHGYISYAVFCLKKKKKKKKTKKE